MRASGIGAAPPAASAALIVFAKAPVAGLAKTRLAPALGAAGAAALAERMLVHAVDAAAAAASASGALLELCVAPDAAHPAFSRLAARHGCALALQGEGDLGTRMRRALERALARHRAALLVGTDAPALDAPMLRAALARLATHDAVFVPARDGGYVAIGLGRPVPALFADMPWSTDRVMVHSRERLRAAGLAWAELEPVHDIDEPADLAHLPPGWLAAPG